MQNLCMVYFFFFQAEDGIRDLTVTGVQTCALPISSRKLRDFLFADSARRNIAELGLGCNPKARVWENVLEDEKAGPHIALGRSEHIGGVTGPDAFNDPRHVWHEDFVYARESPIQIRKLTLVDAAGHREPLFENGSYIPELEIAI